MGNNSQESSYRSLLKATSLFGSIQGFNIVFSLIKTKVITLVLGVSGLGIIGLFTSTLNLISEFSKLGIDTSAVKELSFALKQKDDDSISNIVSALNKIILVFGAVIAVLMLLFSSYVSQFTFGDTSYKWSFAFLNLVVLFNLLTAVKLSVLQGLRQLKSLAKVNLIASLLSLIVVIPLYIYLKFKGIVVALILSSIVTYLVSWYYVNKLAIKKVKHSTKKAFKSYQSMIKLGVMFSVSGVLALLTAYLIRVGVGYLSDIETVGYYTAGMIILESYFGLVFKAIQTDYFPRISALSDDDNGLSTIVSQQAVIGLLLIMPIIIFCMALMPLILRLLYSSSFVVVSQFMYWALFGLLFKTASWTIGYVILAKSDSNLFVKTAVIFNSLFLTLTLLGFHYLGLKGVGIAYVAYFLIHFTVLLLLTRKRYSLKLNQEFWSVFISAFFIVLIGFAFTFFKSPSIKTISISILFVLSAFYSVYKLNKIANLRRFFNSIFKTSK